MPTSPIDEFNHFSAMPAGSLETFSPLVKPAVVELWHMHGIGCTTDGFLKVIGPAYYLTMIGEYLPRPDMIPVLATGMGGHRRRLLREIPRPSIPVCPSDRRSRIQSRPYRAPSSRP